MNRILRFSIILLFTVGCSTKKKDPPKYKSESAFIDSTDFKFFGLKEFDIHKWYDGEVKLKALTKNQVEKYYQYRLRPDTSDTTYYLFYSIQKNLDEQKIITIIDGATGRFPDLRMLTYDENDSLIGFYTVAGMGGSPDWNFKYKVASKQDTDSTFLSTRIDEYVSEFDTLGKVKRDSTITRFRINLGYMKGVNVLEKKKYKLE
ncbi:hypothetical protein DHD32_22875 [Arenibacter sp. TNZ]|jgi:hypothetical protein|uniref:hypothetical protein n=1 Tax=Arenibacter TaxID=178469 RepID=UPI000CD477AC|nr:MULTISPECIES: hypothetical protein [Arenibacter]MCM4174311.1 hypothetical protein [Arenibacter sp. TNZ]